LSLSLTLSFHFRFDTPKPTRNGRPFPARVVLRQGLVYRKRRRRSVRPLHQQDTPTGSCSKTYDEATQPGNICSRALTSDKMDETIVMEWGPFIPTDIDRGDWINAKIKDHKLAKHTANALLLYPSLESHC
jgi:hypothetical protein